METKILDLEHEQSLKHLVQHTARAFYGPAHIIIMDILIIQRVVRKDVLVQRLGLSVKEVDKMVERLVGDGLVQRYQLSDLNDSEGEATSIYYYLDYARFIRVVKWRIKNMHQTLVSRMATAVDECGFICSQCETRYSQLQANDLLDQKSQQLVCEICYEEVREDINDENIIISQSYLARFDRQTRFIVADLRVAETSIVPQFDVSTAVQQYRSPANLTHAQQTVNTSSRVRAQYRPPPVRVLIMPDAPTTSSEAESSSSRRRYDDTLPVWHVKSAISDDLTVDMRRVQSESPEGIRDKINRTVHSDPTLRGLGSFWPPTKGDALGNEEIQSAELDQYYTKLASSLPKRSRSPDDVSRGPNKQTRVQDQFHTWDVPGDFIVSVAGHSREISSLTAEDCASMDESEYSAFVDAITMPLK